MTTEALRREIEKLKIKRAIAVTNVDEQLLFKKDVDQIMLRIAEHDRHVIGENIKNPTEHGRLWNQLKEDQRLRAGINDKGEKI